MLPRDSLVIIAEVSAFVNNKKQIYRKIFENRKMGKYGNQERETEADNPSVMAYRRATSPCVLAGFISFAVSSQAPHRSLPAKAESSFTPLLLLCVLKPSL